VTVAGGMPSLEGKLAVVTGAANGIGYALAERFTTEGMRVVLADVEAEALDAAVRRIGGTAVGMVTDVSDRGSVFDLAARCASLGPVSVLCNNAGVGPRRNLIWETTEDEWKWGVGVNLFGTINGIHAFVPDMVARNDGYVINTSSPAGLLSRPLQGIYAATKFAIIGLSRTLREDLMSAGSSVGVAVLLPGLTRTAALDAERNRRRRLGLAADPNYVEHPTTRTLRERMQAHGADPAECVANVPDAIRSGDFWIQPSLDTYREALLEDTQRLAAGQNPIFRGSPSIDAPARPKPPMTPSTF
jgi:NAD(P)-dependent dehydrogenase (short-subunit alcohol dehydrogenase family)